MSPESHCGLAELEDEAPFLYPMSIRTLLRRFLYSTFFAIGSVRTVIRGPCRGIKYRIFSQYGLGYFFGRWELAEMRVVADVVRRDTVVYDLGANVGMYTLFLARLVGPFGKVYSFEPLPRNIEELTANTHLNKFYNVSIVPMAAAKSSGSMPFATSNSTASGHIVTESGSDDVVYVQTVSLDDFVLRDGKEPPVFIKIDVEGAEGDVLAGAYEVVRRYRPIMLIELHNPEADVAVGKLLNELGYFATRIDTGEDVQDMNSGWPNPKGLWGRVLARPLTGLALDCGDNNPQSNRVAPS